MVAIARATRKIDHYRDSQLRRQFNRSFAGFGIYLCNRLVRMQRIAMRTQRADRESMILDLLFEFFQLLFVVEHGKLAMWIAGIISRSQLDRCDLQLLEFFKNFLERKLR